jgi:hypothetical protein
MMDWHDLLQSSFQKLLNEEMVARDGGPDVPSAMKQSSEKAKMPTKNSKNFDKLTNSLNCRTGFQKS